MNTELWLKDSVLNISNFWCFLFCLKVTIVSSQWLQVSMTMCFGQQSWTCGSAVRGKVNQTCFFWFVIVTWADKRLWFSVCVYILTLSAQLHTQLTLTTAWTHFPDITLCVCVRECVFVCVCVCVCVWERECVCVCERCSVHASETHGREEIVE